jgi:DNA-directed RNA polymerase specialized sigma subunit
MPVGPSYRLDREYENLVNEIRVEQGFTLASLGKELGIATNHVWQITQAYVGPTDEKSGKLRPWAKKMEELFGYDLSEIFPREFCNLQKRHALTDEQVAHICHGNQPHNPYDEVLASVMQAMKKVLTRRERSCMLAYHFDGLTYDEIGKVHKVCGCRAGQIIAKAEMKIREYLYLSEKILKRKLGV